MAGDRYVNRSFSGAHSQSIHFVSVYQHLKIIGLIQTLPKRKTLLSAFYGIFRHFAVPKLNTGQNKTY